MFSECSDQTGGWMFFSTWALVLLKLLEVFSFKKKKSSLYIIGCLIFRSSLRQKDISHAESLFIKLETERTDFVTKNRSLTGYQTIIRMVFSLFMQFSGATKQICSPVYMYISCTPTFNLMFNCSRAVENISFFFFFILFAGRDRFYSYFLRRVHYHFSS